MFGNLPELANVIILATLAGLVSSILGGVLALALGRPRKTFIGLSFVFAAAVLLALVFVDFIPHAIGHGHYHVGTDSQTGELYRYWHQHSGAGIWLTLLGIGTGAGLVLLLGRFDTYGHEHIHGVFPHTEVCSHTGLTFSERRRLLVTALPVALAIIFHDFPKGLAIGSAGSILAALAIGLSCVPEGMTIAIPLKAGGMKSWKILGICGLAGLATVTGAVVGYLIGGIGPYFSGMMFAIAAGCILTVVFSEILPLGLEYAGKSRWKVAVALCGILLVVFLNYFFHDLTH